MTERHPYTLQRLRELLLCCLLAVSAHAGAQTFVNLKASDIAIDSVIPYYTHTTPLPRRYTDSIYTATLRYPEYINMSATDVEKYVRLKCGLGDNAPRPLVAYLADSLKHTMGALPQIEQRVVVERRRGHLETILVPIAVHEGQWKWMVSFMLQIESRPKNPNQPPTPNPTHYNNRYKEHSVLATGTWAKIRVPATGVYRITNELVRQAGFTDASKVKIYGYGGALQPEVIEEDYLISTDDLKEVPTYYNSKGQRLFHAIGPVTYQDELLGDIATPYNYKTSQNVVQARRRNYFSDYGYYFLTQDEAEPQTVDSATFAGSFYPSPHYNNSLYEVDRYAWYQGGRQLYDSKAIPLGTGADFSIPRRGSGESGRMILYVTADRATTVSVKLNDVDLGSFRVTTTDTYDHGSRAGQIYQVDNLAANNTVHIENTGSGTVRLDYIQLTVDDQNIAPPPQLSAGNFPIPEYVHRITNQDLHATPQADMVIIIPTSQHLLQQADRLKQHHEQFDNLRVVIVPADELYNEFSSGTPDANAYRRFVKMLYDRAEDEADLPKYLLLFGDGAWDNRMLTDEWNATTPDNFLLCVESENSLNEILCYVDDCFYGLLDDGEGGNPMSSDKLDIGIGRFPVRDNEQAKVMVDKTIAYALNANGGSWQNTLMFMGDDGNANEHMRDADDAAEDIRSRYPSYLIRKVMWDAYPRETSATGNSYPEATKIIRQQQQQGALILDYAGHGSEISISHERVLTIADFQNFRNDNLPLWITASCDIMPFDAATTNIGEEALLNSRGGAIAFFGTTRTVYANRNRVMNMAYLRHVLNVEDGRRITLGEAQRRAKNDLITSGQDRTTNKMQYSLLGDPALSLNTPTEQIVVDSVDNQPLSSTDGVQIRAGQTVTVKGHIERQGQIVDTFNGTVHATVHDAQEQIAGKRNDPDMDKVTPPTKAFTFYDRTKTLFAGQDNVKDGYFEFTFAVPMDINYTNESGLVTLHAIDGQQRQSIAHGLTDKITVGLTAAGSNDSIGPSIYCYLNSPSFVNGGKVNTTPYFVAEISDKDGINAAGTGIGHDMELSIDGRKTLTFTLNDNFRFDFGSYTSGSTFYSLPELEPGPHTLTFRAWDILNNPSTATLDFQVVKGLSPNLFSVDCTDNPARSTTTFIINHDRTGSNMDVEIDIYDMSGRQLWHHAESGVPTSGAYTTTWNLQTDGGRRLQTGVYLYRATISTDGSRKVSKAQKLIVINR